MKTLKRILVIVLTAAVLGVSSLALTSCKEDIEPTGDVDITAHWSFYSVTGDGETTYRLPMDREEDLPYFICDGSDFEISTVPGSVHRGYVTENEDGSYTLTMYENERQFTAKIDGNMFTIYYPGERELVFEAVD